MNLNYGSTKDFTLIQITFGNVMKTIALPLNQGKFDCVAKRSEIRLESEN